MTPLANGHGFVIRYDLHHDSGHDELLMTFAGTNSMVSGPGVRLFARPFQSTPEAETERQPIVTPEVVLVYSGRIDNREEIAHRLGKPALASASAGSPMARYAIPPRGTSGT